ncbi:MAG: PIG-L deacetylase family protein [Candidatus Hodarchaeales archaeon]
MLPSLVLFQLIARENIEFLKIVLKFNPIFVWDVEGQLMFENILALSPHTDDVEIGCGGTLSKFQEKGSNIRVIAFSWCKLKELKQEITESSKILGINTLDILDFPHRNFFLKRQEILDVLYDIATTSKVDLVLVPSTRDLHQDHQVICREALRAFKNSSIWGYEMPWNNIIFQTNCFVKLSRENIEKKIKALNCYKSQKHRNYFQEDFQWSITKTRGTQIGSKYAEAFELIKLVIS